MINTPGGFLLAVFLAARPEIAPSAPTGLTSPEAVVESQLEAYNAHDVAAFLAAYADDAQIFEHPAKLLANGKAEMRERYTARFKGANLHAVVVKRIVMGNIVVDHERVTRTFPEGPGTADAVLIYEIQSGKIARAWLIPGPKILESKR